MKKRTIKINGKKIKIELLSPADLENEALRGQVPADIKKDIGIKSKRILPKLKMVPLTKEEIENNRKFLELIKG
jgi:CRISPR/Cas system CMR-associated protein Cmr3 (group 5 of RAMP superfamily)